MYRTRQIRIKKGHRLYPFCREICAASAALYNRGNYLVRQYATALRRLEEGEELTENQWEAYDLIRKVTEGTKYEPKSGWLNYGQLDYLLKVTDDPAYRAMPAQANQQTLKLLLRDYKGFFESLKRFREMPDLFTGRPKLPGYKKKGCLKTAVLTNQICTIREGRYLKFPGTKERLNIGRDIMEDTFKGDSKIRLKEVRIKPRAREFMIDVVLQYEEGMSSACGNPLCRMTEQELKKHLTGIRENIYRVISIDPGTANFCAVTNNFGAKPFLVRGSVIKSRNNYYNKELARLRSQAKKCNDRYNTQRISRLHEKRNRIMKDLMHKASRLVADWAEENRADLVILGHNVFQKQKIRLTHANNQTFVQIPFQVFAGMLKYKLEERGIAFLETEEAYTSQADFLAEDPIPEYRKGSVALEMSGKRIKRGLYRHSDGTLSNADINGAANIMRKVFPNVTGWDKGIVDMPYAVIAA